MSIFSKIGAWFAKIFKSIKDHAAPVAVAVTEGVKTFLVSGVAGALAGVIDSIIGSHVAEEIVTLLKNNINKALAVELAVQGLPDNPTQDNIQSFEDAIIKAFSGLEPAGKSKLYTTLAAQVYGIIENTLNENPKPTFAQWVAAVEEAYNDYLKDKANEDAETVNDNAVVAPVPAM